MFSSNRAIIFRAARMADESLDEGAGFPDDVEPPSGGWEKRVLVAAPSDDGRQPAPGNRVRLHLECRAGDHVVEDSRARGVPVELRVGRGNFARGLDSALQDMRVGEKAEVRLEPDAAYGVHGVPTLHIPPSAALVYTVELLDVVEEAELWDMGFEEKMAQAEWRRERGVDLFKAGHAHHAHEEFLQGQRYLAYMLELTDAQAQAVCAAKLKSELNCAASALKLGLEREALKHCAAALDAEPDNAKALYRKAQALAALGRFEEADATCALLIAAHPADGEGEKLRQRIHGRMSELERRQQRCYQRMFTALGNDEPQPEPATLPARAAQLFAKLWAAERGGRAQPAARALRRLLLILIGLALSTVVSWLVRHAVGAGRSPGSGAWSDVRPASSAVFSTSSGDGGDQ